MEYVSMAGSNDAEIKRVGMMWTSWQVIMHIQSQTESVQVSTDEAIPFPPSCGN